MKWLIQQLTLALLLWSSCHGDAINLEAQLDEFVAKLLTCRDIVGMSVAVVKGNQTLLTKGYGVLDRELDEQTTQQQTTANGTSLFGIASLTKAFTALLLGQVLEENGYSWDTRVRDVLGDDFFLYDGLRTSQATMKDLAAHRLGIPSNNNARFQRPTRQQMAMKLRYLEPTLSFRSSYIYSNLMYGLMTYITEQLAGQSWEQLLQQRIFQPLGMSSTTFTHQEGLDLERADIAKPYMKTGEEFRRVDMKFHSFWGELGGSGSIMSNAEDMAKWLYLQLNEGTNEEGLPVISNKVLKVTHEAANVVPPTRYSELFSSSWLPGILDQSAYGLGWRIGRLNGLKLSLHTGTSWGYGGLIMILHEQDIAIYTGITGTDNGYTGRYLTQMFIADLLLGKTPWIDTTTICTFPQPWIPEETDDSSKNKKSDDPLTTVIPLHPLDTYSGDYGNFAYGNISFQVDNSSLYLNYGQYGQWQLIPTADNKFKGLGRDYIWMRNVSSIYFESSANSESFDKVTVSFDSKRPPVFIRGLKMSESPPPPDATFCGVNAGRKLTVDYLIFVIILIKSMRYII